MEAKRIFRWNVVLLVLLVSAVNLVLFAKEQDTYQEVLLYGEDSSFVTEEDRKSYDMYDVYEVYTALKQPCLSLSGEELTAALERVKKEESAVRVAYRESNPDGYDRSYLEMRIKSITLLENEVKELLLYPEDISTVISEAKRQSKISIFSNPKSFSYQNLQKTGRDFQRLSDVEIMMSENRTFSALLRFDFAKWLMLFLMLMIVWKLMDERRKGLWSMVYAAKGGRLLLAVRRAGILLLASVGIVLLIYVPVICYGLSVYGESFSSMRDLLQCVPECRHALLLCSKLEFLILWMILLSLGLALLGAFSWMLLSLFLEVRVGTLVLGAALAAEYLCYALIPLKSVMSIFRHINLFTLLSPAEALLEYRNWGFGTCIVGRPVLYLILLSVMCFVILPTTIFMQYRRHPVGSVSRFERLAEQGMMFIRKQCTAFPVWMKEIQKILFSQKGIWMYLCLLLFVLNNQMQVGTIYTAEDTNRLFFYKNYEGKGEKEVQVFRDKYQAELDSLLAFQEKNLSEGIQDMNLEKRLSNCREMLALADSQLALLQNVSSRHAEAVVINSYPYESLLGSRVAKHETTNALSAVLLLILLLHGILSFEEERQMKFLLRGNVCGRGRLYRNKLLATVAVTLLTAGIVYGISASHLMELFAPKYMQYAVQNLALLQDFPLVISIRSYFLLLFVYRLFLLFMFAGVVMGISAYCKYRRSLPFSLLLLFPVVFSFVGFHGLDWLSAIRPIAYNALRTEQETMLLRLIPAIVMTVLGITGYILGRRKWVHT